MFKRGRRSPGHEGIALIKWSAAALLLLVPGASPPATEPALAQSYAQLRVRQQVLVRIPVRARQISPASASLHQWKEGKGPACIPTRAIIGASLLSQHSVDLILRDRRRIRAKLESSCPALDYYYGFYVTPNADGLICADRDIIRSRMGGQCEIERFRLLQAVRRD
jgi:hypothetical protein